MNDDAKEYMTWQDFVLQWAIDSGNTYAQLTTDERAYYNQMMAINDIDANFVDAMIDIKTISDTNGFSGISKWLNNILDDNDAVLSENGVNGLAESAYPFSNGELRRLANLSESDVNDMTPQNYVQAISSAMFDAIGEIVEYVIHVSPESVKQSILDSIDLDE